MSHFYGEIQGNRGEGTRGGTKASGIRGHIRGWNIGARVTCFVDDDGKDSVMVSITGGSNDQYDSVCIGEWKRGETGAAEYIKS